MEGIIIGIILIVAMVFVLRLFGAWMLRIDEVIKELQEIKTLLRQANRPKDEQSDEQSDFHKSI